MYMTLKIRTISPQQELGISINIEGVGY